MNDLTIDETNRLQIKVKELHSALPEEQRQKEIEIKELRAKLAENDKLNQKMRDDVDWLKNMVNKHSKENPAVVSSKFEELRYIKKGENGITMIRSIKDDDSNINNNSQ